MKYNTKLPWGPNVSDVPSFLHHKDGYNPSQKVANSKLATRSAVAVKGKHASLQNFLGVTSSWDASSASFRLELLKDFIENNKGKTCPELDKDLCNGAALFLTRISAWLRLSYLSTSDLKTQLQAINVFLAAAGGQQFLIEFVESGGLLTVLEILSLPKTSDSEKTEALLSIYYIAVAGRQFKDFICESYGVRSICECMVRSKSPATLEKSKTLLIQMSSGNLKAASQCFKALVAILVSPSATTASQIAGAQTLRQLLNIKQQLNTSLVDIALQLLGSLNLQLQYEAMELLFQLFQRDELQLYLIKQVCTILSTPVEFDSSALGSDVFLTAGAANKLQLSDQHALDELGKKVPHIVSQLIQQAYCAKLVSVTIATSEDIALSFIDNQVVCGLLNVISNVDHREGQKFASNALRFLIDKHECISTALRISVGDKFLQLVQSRPDTFYRELTRKQIDYLKHNEISIARRKADSSEDTSSLLESSQLDLASAMLNRHQNYAAEANVNLSLRKAFPMDTDEFSSQKESESNPQAKTAQADSESNTKDTGKAGAREATPKPISTSTDEAKATTANNAHLNEDGQSNMKASDAPAVKLYVPLVTLSTNKTFVGNAFCAEQTTDTTESLFEKSLTSFKKLQLDTNTNQLALDGSVGAHTIEEPVVSLNNSKKMSQSIKPGVFKMAVPVPELAKKSDKDADDDFLQMGAN